MAQFIETIMINLDMLYFTLHHCKYQKRTYTNMSTGRQYNTYKLSGERDQVRPVYIQSYEAVGCIYSGRKSGVWCISAFLGAVRRIQFCQEGDSWPTTIYQQLPMSQTDRSTALTLNPDQRFCCVFTTNDGTTLFTRPRFIIFFFKTSFVV